MTKKSNGKLKNLYRKMIFGKVLIVLYIVLPMLLVATGFSAWVINTPSVSQDFFGTTTSSAVIDTSALMQVTKFEPIEELYYTGPVGSPVDNPENKDYFKRQLNIETMININPYKVLEFAKESANTMYLRLTIMLKSNDSSMAIFDNFTLSFAGDTNPNDGVTVEAIPDKTQIADSIYSVMFKLTFDAEATFEDMFSLTLTTSFELNSNGYAAYYDYCIAQQGSDSIKKNPFVLDLRLSESDT